MTDLQIRSDGVLEAFSAKLADMPDWLPEIFAEHMPDLGAIAAEAMQGLMETNRYTGELQDSITVEYNALTQEVMIRPTASRGNYDAGALLELGVPHAIPNAPYGPIAAWAEARGLPAYPVWYKIRTEGIAAHPFLQRTADDSQTAMAMDEAARRIVTDAGLAIASAGPANSIGVEQSL